MVYTQPLQLFPGLYRLPEAACAVVLLLAHPHAPDSHAHAAAQPRFTQLLQRCAIGRAHHMQLRFMGGNVQLQVRQLSLPSPA